MSLTKIGSIGIHTGIQFAGVTTVSTLKVGSGVTLSSDGDVFATGISTFSEDIKVGSGVTISPDGDGFYTGVVTATTFSGALAASNLTGALPAISGANLTNLDASDLASGTVPTARLGSGTASSSTFLRGDSTFQTVNTDLVSDTSPQLGGNLDVNSKTINLGDSSGETVNRIRLGADNDGDLFHDGTDLFLREVDSGQILLRSDGAKVFANANGSENQAIFRANGNVELYYDNSKKIETTTNGIAVTGQMYGNSAQIVGAAGGDAELKLFSDGGSQVADKVRIRQTHVGNSFLVESFANGSSYQSILKGTDARTIELHYQGTKKFETTSAGATVTGTLTATSFAGDGSALTGLGGGVPSGCIILWSGAANAIPTGYVLCDGNNSTPNLSGKFVVGYHASNGDYDVNDTGGAETVTLTEAQMPAHNHHSYIADDSSGPFGHVRASGNNNTQGAVATTTKGSGNAHENRPPYYALCYIMKT